MGHLLVALMMLAATSKEECAKDHDLAQRLRLDGKLKAARERAAACAAEGCPALVRRECVGILEELVRLQPSVLVSVRVGGADAVGTRLQLDGEELVFSGRPVPVDPGEHQLVALLSDGRRVETRFLAQLGEQNRTLALEAEEVRVAAQPESAPPMPTIVAASKRPRPWGVVVSSGLTLALAASFTGFALHGRALENQAAANCAPGCPPERVNAIRVDYAVADLSLLGGAITLGVAVVLGILYGAGGP